MVDTIVVGNLDLSFGNGGKVTTDFNSDSDYGYDILLQPDDKILVAGYALQPSGGSIFALARYTSDGNLDPTFGNDGRVTTDFGGVGVGRGVVLMPDGKIVLAGYASLRGSFSDFALVRYTANGMIDPTFGIDGKILTDFGSDDYVSDLVLQSDSKIVVAGWTNSSVSSGSDFAIARYTRDGTLDSTFGREGKVTTSFGGPDLINGITLQPDGKIIAVGKQNFIFPILVRYTSNGILDSSFGNKGEITLNLEGISAIVQPDSKIIVAGTAENDFALVRYNPNGTLDTSFGNKGRIITDFNGHFDVIQNLTLQADSKIVVAGWTNDNPSNSNLENFALARYNSDGTLDLGFGRNGKITTDLNGNSDRASGIALQPDGKVVVAGSTVTSNGKTDFALVRYQGESNVAPNGIELGNSSIPENSRNRTIIGMLTTRDPDATDSYTYMLLDDAEGRFTLSNGQILVANGGLLDFENAPAHTIRVRSTDSAGARFETDLAITLTDVNEPPVLANPIPDLTAIENAPFKFTIPPTTFVDPDRGDALTYTATLSDSIALPAWLTFDAKTQTLSGTPSPKDVGTLTLRITATDKQGLFLTTPVKLRIGEPKLYRLSSWQYVDDGAGGIKLEEDKVIYAEFSNTPPDPFRVYKGGYIVSRDANNNFITTTPSKLKPNDEILQEDIRNQSLTENEIISLLQIDHSTQKNQGQPDEIILSFETKGLPKIGDVSQATLAKLLGYTHFNWIQVVGPEISSSIDWYGASGGPLVADSGKILTSTNRFFDLLPNGNEIYVDWASYFGVSTVEEVVEKFADKYIDEFGAGYTAKSDAVGIVTIETPTKATATIQFVKRAYGVYTDSNEIDADRLRFYIDVTSPDYLDLATNKDDRGGMTSSYTLVLRDDPNLYPKNGEKTQFTTVLVGVKNDNKSSTVLGLKGEKIRWFSNYDNLFSESGGITIGTSPSGGNAIDASLEEGNISTTVTQGTGGIEVTDADVTLDELSLEELQFFKENEVDLSLSKVNLSVVRNNTPGLVNIGEQFTYALTIVNNGSSPATNVALTEVLAPGEKYVAASVPASLNPAGDTITAALGTLDPGESTVINITVSPHSDGDLASTTIITSDEYDADVTDNYLVSTLAVSGSANSSPTLTNISKTGNEDTTIAFILTDFTTAFSDLDSNSLTKVQITTLPTNGILKLSGIAVTGGQEIQAANLNALALEPNTNFNGTISFNWNGFDGTTYAGSPAQANLTFNSINDVPTLVNAIPDQTATAVLPFTFTLAGNSFNDADANDRLTYTTVLTNGNSLPTWLSFDTNSRTFSGTPSATDVGNLDIKVTAIDSQGATAEDTFNLQVVANDSAAPNLAKIGDDIFTISGGTGNSKLQVTLLGANSKSVNELGVFTVDDDKGTINGIAPGDAAYAQAVLDRAKGVLSALSNLPSGFNQNDSTSFVEFNSGDRLRFLLVRDSTVDAVRSGAAPLANVLFSQPSTQKIEFLGDGAYSIAWEDSQGSSVVDFQDLVVKAVATGQELPLGTAVQADSQGELLDLRGVTGQVRADFTLYREAAFDNYVGFFQVADLNGSIDSNADGTVDFRPGDVGYGEAAVRGRVAGIDLNVSNQGTATFTATINGDAIYAPFVIVNGRPEAVLDDNPNNNPEVYFAFSLANPGRFNHVRLLGTNTWGFEDLPLGGDMDYNDIIVRGSFNRIA